MRYTLRTCQEAETQKETIVFQPPIFRCDNASFREGHEYQT